MARRSETKAARLRAWLEEHRPERIGDAELAAIGAALAPISERYLHELVRTSGALLDPLVEGVVQYDFEHLERTLRALENVYEAGDRKRARQAVITAKDHARFAIRRLDQERSVVKREMLLWLMTWLENPPLFPAWVDVRKRRLGESAGEAGN